MRPCGRDSSLALSEPRRPRRDTGKRGRRRGEGKRGPARTGPLRASSPARPGSSPAERPHGRSVTPRRCVRQSSATSFKMQTCPRCWLRDGARDPHFQTSTPSNRSGSRLTRLAQKALAAKRPVSHCLSLRPWPASNAAFWRSPLLAPSYPRLWHGLCRLCGVPLLPPPEPRSNYHSNQM